MPQEEWHGSHFYNDAILTNLGSEVGRFDRRLDLQSRVFHRIVQWLRGCHAALVQGNVAETDIVAVGTAVFRWLENGAEVLTAIEGQSGVAIRVIPEDREALVSIAAVATTYRFRWQPAPIPDFGGDDAILLLDRGGGSLEVSYVFAKKMSLFGIKSHDQLGTIALRDLFFTLGPDNSRVDPDKNRRRISTQNERIRQFIRKRLGEWGGYPELRGKKLYAFAMGSAITKCMPGQSSFRQHNARVTTEGILSKMQEARRAFDESRQVVSTLYRALKMLEDEQRGRRHPRGYEKLDNQLTFVYGLPVYAAVLEMFGLRELRICGYGLRYGVHSWLYKYRQPVSSLEESLDGP